MTSKRRSPWAWVPSLYFAEGLPYIVVMQVSVIMYKRLGISNTEIALYTSWLYLPWVIKPLWSPVVEALRTKRFWILTMQLLVGAGLAGVALMLPGPMFFRLSLAFLWLLAFSSATHDIAADGFYMLGLTQHDQAFFVGIRSTFYRLAMITGQGLLVIFAGSVEARTGLTSHFVEVHAAVEAPPPARPDSVRLQQTPGVPAIVTNATRLELSLQPGAEVEEVITSARQWNAENSFYREVGAPSAGGGARTDSWWKRSVSTPLASVIGRVVGTDPYASAPGIGTGGVGVLYYGMSQPLSADETVAVNLGLDSGDPNIRLIEPAAGRLTFTAANWSVPARVVFQLDPRMDRPATAVFVARAGNTRLAWTLTFYLIAAMMVLLAAYHRFSLPRPAADRPSGSGKARELLRDFVSTFASFFAKPGIVVAIGFFLLFRFAEAQLVKLAAPFLLDAREAGGLALTTGEVGVAYGTVGALALTAGGLLGGFLAAAHGLRRWLWPMVIAINVPNAVYLFLAVARPDSLVLINACVAVEQFGYGFGFTAFLLYMIYMADGPQKTAHFAILTGFMALGMMIPGMFSGWLQEIIGYRSFFVWIMIATIPGFVVSALIKVDPSFGKKSNEHPDARDG